MRVARNSIFYPRTPGTPRLWWGRKWGRGGSRIDPRMTHDKRIKASARNRDKRVIRGVHGGAWCVRRVVCPARQLGELPFEIQELKYFVMRYAIVR